MFTLVSKFFVHFVMSLVFFLFSLLLVCVDVCPLLLLVCVDVCPLLLVCVVWMFVCLFGTRPPEQLLLSSHRVRVRVHQGRPTAWALTGPLWPHKQNKGKGREKEQGHDQHWFIENKHLRR